MHGRFSPMFYYVVSATFNLCSGYQLHFLTNKNTELTVRYYLLKMNCIKIGGLVALLSGPNVYSLYCSTGMARLFLYKPDYTLLIFRSYEFKSLQVVPNLVD